MNYLIKMVSSPNMRTMSVVAGIEASGILKGDQRGTQMLRISKFPLKIYVSVSEIEDLCIPVILNMILSVKSDCNLQPQQTQNQGFVGAELA